VGDDETGTGSKRLIPNSGCREKARLLVGEALNKRILNCDSFARRLLVTCFR
jgi:hypothetical protein